MRTHWNGGWLRLLPIGALVLAACSDNTVAPKALAPNAPRAILSGSGTIADEWNGGPLHGAIFTTLPFGQSVNANVQYTRKIEVYLDGGPRNPNSLAAGLNDGLYVFQITDPSGKYLLSQDPARCRVVQVKGGVIVRGTDDQSRGTVPAPRIPGLGAAYDTWDNTDPAGRPKPGPRCHIESAEADGASLAGQHDTNNDSDLGGGATVQMMPFGTTPNPGGVYKAWITPLSVYVDKAGGIGALNSIPANLKGQAGAACPDFCANPDLGFKNPSRNNVKTDNFKVKENPPFLSITKYVDGVAATQWHVTAFELLGGDWNGKGWTDALPATFAVPLGTDLLACESLPAGYRFVSATVGGAAGIVATPGNTTPAPPTQDDQTPPNPIVCVKVGPLASAGTIAVAFNNHKIVPKAKISIAQNGVNEVGHPHTFTATVQVDRDLVDTPTWEYAADGTIVTFTKVSGPGALDPLTCPTVGGSCSTVLTSSVAGFTTVKAEASPDVGGGQTIHVVTDGVAPNSGPATKQWVDASIVITPLDATNPVNAEHVITATVKQDDGLLANATGGDATTGFGPAPDGTGVTFSLTNSNGATAAFVNGINTCTTVGGQCAVTINSATAGTVKIHATTTFSVGGVSLTRQTGPGWYTSPGDDARKTYYQPQGCTPGFWQGGNGSQLWDATTRPDPDWVSRIGGSNPFRQIDLFNGYSLGSGRFFSAAAELNGMTMLDIVGTGGTDVNAQKTARDVIAAYLNRSAGLLYPFTLTDIVDSWNAANLASPESARQAALLTLHTQLDAANNLHNAPLCQ